MERSISNKPWFVVLLLCLLMNASSEADMNSYCSTPPFINTTNVLPNILVVFDNSNSMDEDFVGNAIGSFSTYDNGTAVSSKSSAGKAAMLNIISDYQTKVRMGLMTYKLATTGVNAYYIHNSPYFVSYEPKSYCPNPPAECATYCKTGNAAAQTTCNTSCQAQNAVFDATYKDEILSNPPYADNSTQRNTYCDNVYPKTQRMVNPADPTRYIYYKMALPFYSSSNQGTAYCYASTYSAYEGTPWDTYKCYTSKTNTNDTDATNYSGLIFTSGLSPTDSDYALGFADFGKRLTWYKAGRTWFNNTSPGIGYLKTSVADMSAGQLTALNNQFASLTETQYMACASADKNTCSYIVNAGLTPTEGTLNSALQYFQGIFNQGGVLPTPIQYKCQRNYIVYVTDGAPSTNPAGTTDTSANLMPNVITKINQLRNITVAGTNYDVQTYVIGLGLTATGKGYLDQMAVAGGTDVSGHAYYVDNTSAMQFALNDIFQDIFKRIASGTSATILAERAKQGSNILQVNFYPNKLFSDYFIKWVGYVNNLWLYNSNNYQNIREDTVQDKILNLQSDYAVTFEFDNLTHSLLVKQQSDTNADGNPDGTITLKSNGMDDLKTIWEAGYQLYLRTPSSRYIYTNGSSGLVSFDNASKNNFKVYMGGDTINTTNTTTTVDNIIEWVRGKEISGLRSRNVVLSPLDNSSVPTWKLGDIVYSTPAIEDYTDNATIPFVGGVAFVGANDGMLHAFNIGQLSTKSLSTNEVGKLLGNGYGFGQELWSFIPRHSLPYLRYLADPQYGQSCHLYSNDLHPYIFYPTKYKKVLIAGMRFGSACGCDPNGPKTACKSGSISILPPTDTCTQPWACSNCTGSNPGSCTCTLSTLNTACVGMSAYYAIDITDPRTPTFLWEFSHPELGYSYSGPAVITQRNSSGNMVRYVVFLSGPNKNTGQSDQSLKMFFLKLNADSTIDSSFNTIGYSIKDLGVNNAFGGRLFNSGVDINNDGLSDFLFFGVSNSPSGQLDDWQGGVIKVYTGGSDPRVECSGNCCNTDCGSCWDFNTTYFNLAKQPITSKLSVGKCFGTWFIHGGSGRYFNPGEDYSISQSDFLFGVPMLYTASNCCDPTTGCSNSINSLHSESITSGDTCSTMTTSRVNNILQKGWTWQLNPTGTTDSFGIVYKKERVVSDPVLTSNVAVFTSTEPSADTCAYGGQSRAWAMNCMLGTSIKDTSTGTTACSSYVVASNVLTGKVFLQLSTAAINQLTLGTAFTGLGGRASAFFTGITPESPPSILAGPSTTKSKLMHYIER
ncbi:MAG: hypothetical protein HQL01_14200 [Nitrospirae bacterium]|nr:hypothetical protein [Nitrospirota bacterium]